ncbi:hypothetical protein [Nocardia sp. NPDC024068]|uniref:hypothetical protein n=1 Tax=Nocardia sp. NPDC024068 TaxID=3157197 RepID=UPI00340AB1B5
MMPPIAFGWIDVEVSRSWEWEFAQVQRLARRLGYRLVWASAESVLPVAEQARGAGAEVVIVPAPDHLGPIALNAVMGVADVETVLPRLSFARWRLTEGVRP